ncbi:RloB domain-containing protein [Novosphingobium pituita]|uniref:RloB domain-containing protein n=1 Tax=Novosphingobium pituita TaxID=3056842 RepID=A0ABQ6P3Y0_9SPHN|nr:hypothetical protein [Novosphingobium sp. IK01]GMM59935.1 hypothetical protein NUTIK01_07120 [Novosphingobium sp. IK01]
MSRRRAAVPQRRRYFIGCEGESEQGYVALLARLAGLRRSAVHLDAVLLQPGGGDPLALVELADRKADERERRSGAFAGRFILLDDDKLGQAPARDARIEAVRARGRFQLIWQRSCHEALLLRHLKGCSQRRPGNTPRALADLEREWQGYRKGLPAARLADRIDEDALGRVAAVEPELAILLAAIGFV